MENEYGFDIRNARVYEGGELKIELDASNFTIDDWHKITGHIPIVRCEHCSHALRVELHANNLTRSWLDCKLSGSLVDEKHFCSRGELRHEEK